jgi:hypothetical protein
MANRRQLNTRPSAHGCQTADSGSRVGSYTWYETVDEGDTRLRRVNVRLLIRLRLFGNQLEREQSVDLAPGGCDIWGHSVAENLADRGEQVLADKSCTARGGCPGIRACRRFAA